MVHEAYQFIQAKKRKLSGRTMKENWDKVGGKSKVEQRSPMSLEYSWDRDIHKVVFLRT